MLLQFLPSFCSPNHHPMEFEFKCVTFLFDHQSSTWSFKSREGMQTFSFTISSLANSVCINFFKSHFTWYVIVCLDWFGRHSIHSKITQELDRFYIFSKPPWTDSSNSFVAWYIVHMWLPFCFSSLSTLFGTFFCSVPLNRHLENELGKIISVFGPQTHLDRSEIFLGSFVYQFRF